MSSTAKLPRTSFNGNQKKKKKRKENMVKNSDTYFSSISTPSDMKERPVSLGL